MNKQVLQKDLMNLTSFCKGMAIIAIFLVHWRGGWFGWQGVHVFIVLSGFGLAYSCFSRSEPPRWLDWFRRRFRRILPVYWLAVWISAIVMLLTQLHPANHVLIRTLSDTFLLTNFFEVFWGGSTGAFWFVIFIISAYLLFPALYYWLKHHPNPRGMMILLVGILAIEWGYRAFAIYTLDGQPIAHDHPFLSLFPNSVTALDQMPEWFNGLFQGRAPFGFILSRIGEFTLGVLAGFACVKYPQKNHHLLLNPVTGWLGLAIWLGAQKLLYIDLWGWIYSDFFIGCGLILWLINLAHWLRRRKSHIYEVISTVGVWSYYIFLIHQPFTRLGSQLAVELWNHSWGKLGYILVSLVFLTLISGIVFCLSWLLRKFDRSTLPELIIDRLFKFPEIIQLQFVLTKKLLKNHFSDS